MRGKEYLYSNLLGKGGKKVGLFFQRTISRGIPINKTVTERSGIKCSGALKSFFPRTVKNVVSLIISIQYYFKNNIEATEL